MMLSEFIERTGFEPTYDEYRKIEADYCDFNGDKDAFCKEFVARGMEQKIYAHRAAYIADLESQLMDAEKAYKSTLAAMQQKIDALTAELDRELDWKPSSGTGTHMDQSRYEQLAHAGRVMTDQEAKELIADECGFSVDKITIVRSVMTYEVNKYRRLRVSGEFDRAPVYESTDWNYVRFDCACMMYELVNGELRFYCC